MFELKLPSGADIEFRGPTYKDRRVVLSSYNKEDGYVPEDALAARCITKVNGNSVLKEEWEVQSTKDYVAIMDSWNFKDQQYYLEVFMNMFSLGEEVRKNAEEVAKKLLMGTDTPSSTTSKK